MKNKMTLLAIVFGMMIFTGTAMAQCDGDGVGPGLGGGNGNGPAGEWLDENGDGFNDLAPDADGDGIPNGMDEDYVRPQDGSGNGNGSGRGSILNSRGIGKGKFGDVDERGSSGNKLRKGYGTCLLDGGRRGLKK